MTLIELMVVILIIAVIAGLLVPALTMTRINAHRPSCGNNQRQIVLTMLVYANENDGVWPCRLSDSTGALVANGGRDAFTTIGTFEFLAAQSGMELPAKLFACPSEPLAKPSSQANPALAISASSISPWCIAAASTHSPLCGYAYDWSAPSNANSMRVVTADRGRGTRAHKTVVMACFGDGHVGNLRTATATAGPVAPNIDGLPCSLGAVNPDAAGDDIYSPAGDGDDPMTPGKGSSTRAWVR